MSSFVLTFQNVETDTTQLVNVGVINLGHKAHFRRSHGVILGQEQLQLKDTSYGTQNKISVSSNKKKRMNGRFLGQNLAVLLSLCPGYKKKKHVS